MPSERRHPSWWVEIPQAELKRRAFRLVTPHEKKHGGVKRCGVYRELTSSLWWAVCECKWELQVFWEKSENPGARLCDWFSTQWGTWDFSKQKGVKIRFLSQITLAWVRGRLEGHGTTEKNSQETFVVTQGEKVRRHGGTWRQRVGRERHWGRKSTAFLVGCR